MGLAAEAHLFFPVSKGAASDESDAWRYEDYREAFFALSDRARRATPLPLVTVSAGKHCD
jgi:hypothetical protein